MAISGILVTVVVLALAGPSPAHAQSASGVEGRIVLGLTFQGGIFGDDSPRSSSRFGMTVGAQIRRHAEQRTGLVLDIAFQPFATKNPHFDERVRVLTVHLAPEIGRGFYVRPGGGVALHFWSGSATETGLSLAPSVSVAVGQHVNVGSRVRLSPEFVARSSMEVGALNWTLAAQVPVSWSAR